MGQAAEDDNELIEHENARCEHKLKSVGMSISDLSLNGESALTSLSELAATLALDDLSLASFALGIDQFEREHKRLVEEKVEAVEQTRKIRVKKEKAVAALEEIRKLKQECEEQSSRLESTKQMEESIEKIQLKNISYEENISSLKVNLKERNIISKDGTLSPPPGHYRYHQLLELNAKIKEADIEKARLNAQLSKFHNLPLDKQQVAIMVHEKQQELSKLQASFDEKIENMA